MSSSVKRNTYFVSIGQFTQLVLSFILVPVAARCLGDEGFGVYSLATAIMVSIFLVNDFGMNTLITREIARDREQTETLYGGALGVKLILGVLCVALLILAWQVYNLTLAARTAIGLFSLYGILLSVVQLNYGVFRGFEKMQYETVVLVLEKLLITGLGVFVLVRGLGLIAFSLVFVGAGVVSLVVSFALVRKNFFSRNLRLNWAVAKRVFKMSLPLGASFFMITIYDRVNVLMLGAMKSEEVVGWYSAAFKLIAVTNVVPSILVTASFPKMSQDSIGRRAELASLFTKGFKYLLFLALPMVAGGILLANKIIHLLYGSEFDNAVPVLRILMWTAGFNFLNVYLSGLFWAAGRQNQLLIFQTLGLLCNVGLNIALIPHYAQIGAAASTVATEGLIFTGCLIFALVNITRMQEKTFIVKTVAATAAMILFILQVNELPLGFLIVGSLGIYFASLYVLRGFKFGDLLLLKQKPGALP